MLILFSVLALIQAQSLANNAQLGAARKDIARHFAEDSTYDLLRSIAGDAMVDASTETPGIFASEPLQVPVLKDTVTVRLQDVEGLPDLYRDTPAVLSLVPQVGPQVARAVQERRSSPGGWPSYPTVASALAQLGLSSVEISLWGPFYSQSGKADGLRLENVPDVLVRNGGAMADVPQVYGQVTQVEIANQR